MYIMDFDRLLGTRQRALVICYDISIIMPFCVLDNELMATEEENTSLFFW
jgi:hypothetical protein